MRSTDDFDGARSKSRRMATRGVVWPVTHLVALAAVDHRRAESPRTITLDIEAATIATLRLWVSGGMDLRVL